MFKDAFTAFAKKLREIKASILLPAEQITADQKLGWGMTELNRACEDIDTLMGLAEKEVQATASKAAADALAEAIKDGKVIRKEDHETAITAAKDTTRTAVEKEFNAKAEQTKFAQDKRTELGALITAEAAALIPDELLTKEKADATIKAIKDRVTALNEKGITKESLPSAFKTVASVTDDTLYAACIQPVIDAKAAGGKVDAKASADGKVQPQGKPAGSEGAVTDERELIS